MGQIYETLPHKWKMSIILGSPLNLKCFDQSDFMERGA